MGRALRLGWLRRSSLGLALLVAIVPWTSPITSLAQEFTVSGTLDCGEASEEYCPIRDRMSFWTEDLSGTREKVTIRTSWIREQMIYALALQDDYFVFKAEPRPKGGLRLLAVEDHVTQGNNFSKRDPRDENRSDQPQHRQEKEKD